MRDTLFIWVEAYEYPSGLRIEAFLWSASIIFREVHEGAVFHLLFFLKVEHYLFLHLFLLLKEGH